MSGNVSSIMKKAEELMRLGYMYEVFIRQGRYRYSVNCPDGQLAYNKRLSFSFKKCVVMKFCQTFGRNFTSCIIHICKTTKKNVAFIEKTARVIQ